MPKVFWSVRREISWERDLDSAWRWEVFWSAMLILFKKFLLRNFFSHFLYFLLPKLSFLLKISVFLWVFPLFFPLSKFNSHSTKFPLHLHLPARLFILKRHTLSSLYLSPWLSRKERVHMYIYLGWTVHTLKLGNKTSTIPYWKLLIFPLLFLYFKVPPIEHTWKRKGICRYLINIPQRPIFLRGARIYPKAV